MKSSGKISFICYGVTFALFLIIFLWGTIGSITGNEMGYTVLCFYLFMPFTSLVMAFILGINTAHMKWLYPVIFGILGFIIPWAIFKTMDVFALFFSFIPAM